MPARGAKKRETKSQSLPGAVDDRPAAIHRGELAHIRSQGSDLVFGLEHAEAIARPQEFGRPGA